MFDKKKENSPPELDDDEKKILKDKEDAAEKLKNAPPAKVKCNCKKQILDPTPKGKPCSYCGGLVG